MNKRGFDCVLCMLFFCSFSSFPSSICLSFSPLYHPGSLPFFFSFFLLVPLQVLNHLPFAYLSLTSLCSTRLHYEVQLRITPGKFIFIFLDSFTFQKIYITISFFICLHYHFLFHLLNACSMLHENMHCISLLLAPR